MLQISLWMGENERNSNCVSFYLQGLQEPWECNTLPWDAAKCTIKLFEKNSRVGLSQNHLLNILNFNTQKILLSIPWHLKYESYLNIYANFLEYTFTISRQAPSTYANAHSKYFKTWLIFVRDLQKKSQIWQ